jgi:soluble lytic murein transglycosylase-like protein
VADVMCQRSQRGGELGFSFARMVTAGLVAALLLAACSGTVPRGYINVSTSKRVPLTSVNFAAPVKPSSLDGLIAKYAAIYEVPESLIRRVIVRESGYNAKARNGPYYGLMQISYATAQSMGYRGPASDLLDAETNLKYAVKYLAGAYLVAGNSADGAVRNYSSGYYYDAKRKGLLEEVGLR